MMTEQERAERRRIAHLATDRARDVLKPGDRLYVIRCGGSKSTITMTGWDGNWITCRSRDDIAAVNVLRVNGKPVAFGAEPLSDTHRPEGT